MLIKFFKYQGAGNDFVVLDNRNDEYSNLAEEQIKHLCNRRFSIGADGLMLMNKKEGVDFEMIYFNANGRAGSMCGNGGRCMVRFAQKLGMHKYTYKFMAADGLHEAEIDNNNIIRLKMKDITEVEEHPNFAIVNTGSPHFIKFATDIHNIDVVESGRDIRNSKKFIKEGINVNFVETIGEDKIYVRTYERGVEDETLSCGTGVTASALVSAHNNRGFNRVEVHTPGGNLSVEYNKVDEKSFTNIWLCGPAELVFTGETEIV
ncbi:MAG: diaminopimelate epimerase [Ferruginibacter sp.]